MPVSFNATFKESGGFNASFEEVNDLNAEFGAIIDVGSVFPSDDLPLMDGNAEPGTSRKFSRSDHRHPHDTDKMDYMTAITNLELEEILK